MNKVVNVHQLTILWHVDDLKVSHMELKVTKEFLEELNTTYGKEALIQVTLGKKHPYLGMVINYLEDGFVTINMQDYITKMLSDATPEMQEQA